MNELDHTYVRMHIPGKYIVSFTNKTTKEGSLFSTLLNSTNRVLFYSITISISNH
ncbi:hypothetical protein HanIR_Chr13g0670211 [Helianthus annuus]|nr:hypothetical protein HanIR_Chr13g0670211 [Helianthus annuus]